MSTAIFIILIGVVLILITISSLISSFIITTIFGAPYVGTPKSIARDMLRFADFQPGQSFIDLGSGSGTLLITAVTEFKADRAIGYEIHPFLAWLTRQRAKLNRIARKVEVHRGNFFKNKVEQVDLVAVYLWPSTMDKLVSKLKNELDPETHIVSRGFKFTGVEPIKITPGPVSVLYLYRAGDLK